MQSKVQDLADAGQALTDELSAALEVLQPVIDLSEDMLDSLDRLTSTITDTITGIGVELMESLLPILTEIMDTLTPVAESLQPALEAVGDLLRTLLELFGTLVSSVMTALQPVLGGHRTADRSLGNPAEHHRHPRFHFPFPCAEGIGRVLSWLLQPIEWVAEAIRSVATFIVNLLNSVLNFSGLKLTCRTGPQPTKGEAFDEITNALEDNTDALEGKQRFDPQPAPVPDPAVAGPPPASSTTAPCWPPPGQHAEPEHPGGYQLRCRQRPDRSPPERLLEGFKHHRSQRGRQRGSPGYTPYVDEDMAF